MKNVISAELYKLKHDRVMWFLPVLYVALGVFCVPPEHEVFDLYRGLEFFALPGLTNVTVILSLAAAVVTGYVIGGDFSRRTVQNALSAGTDRKHYYFARLWVQMLLTGALFSLTLLIYLTGRLLHPRGNADMTVSLLWAKLAVYMAVLLLQLLAYVSVVNAICYFVKKRLAAVAAGMGLIYLELIFRQAVFAYETGFLQRILDYTPSGVIRRLFSYAVYDRIFTADFLLPSLSAAVIIVAGSAVGYWKFCHDMDVN